MRKIIDFFKTDLGEIVLHCLVALIAALAIAHWVEGYFQLLFNAALIVGFFIRELWQHNWDLADMGTQSWLEWIFPAIVILVVFAL